MQRNRGGLGAEAPGCCDGVMRAYGPDIAIARRVALVTLSLSYGKAGVGISQAADTRILDSKGSRVTWP